MTAFGQCTYPGHQPAAAPLWRRQDPHPVDPSRRRRIEDPDEYERGRGDGQDDPDKGGKKLWLWLRRAGLVTGATAALIPAPVLWPVAALVALGLALPEPASGPVGRRGQSTPPEAEWHPERRHSDAPRRATADTPESELDGWREGRR